MEGIVFILIGLVVIGFLGYLIKKTCLGRLIKIVGGIVFILFLASFIIPEAFDTSLNTESKSPPMTETLLPHLAEYTEVEGKYVTDFVSVIASVAGEQKLPEIVGSVSDMASCYQEKGVVGLRIYVNKANQLSAGVIAIADEREFSDPKNLVNCMLTNFSYSQGSERIELCTDSYTLQHDSKVFRIAYAGSTSKACHDFCSALQGCNAQ